MYNVLYKLVEAQQIVVDENSKIKPKNKNEKKWFQEKFEDTKEVIRSCKSKDKQ